MRLSAQDLLDCWYTTYCLRLKQTIWLGRRCNFIWEGQIGVESIESPVEDGESWIILLDLDVDILEVESQSITRTQYFYRASWDLSAIYLVRSGPYCDDGAASR